MKSLETKISSYSKTDANQQKKNFLSFKLTYESQMTFHLMFSIEIKMKWNILDINLNHNDITYMLIWLRWCVVTTRDESVLFPDTFFSTSLNSPVIVARWKQWMWQCNLRWKQVGEFEIPESCQTFVDSNGGKKSI